MQTSQWEKAAEEMMGRVIGGTKWAGRAWRSPGRLAIRGWFEGHCASEECAHRLLGQNCSSSVDSASARVDEFPFETIWVTRSK